MNRGRDITDITLLAKARGLDGVPEGVDHDDPASVLMASEDAQNAPPVVDRGDVAALLMGHLFGEGPHPEEVTVRLYRLTTAVAPELLQALPFAERAVLTADDELAKDERLVALLRGTRLRRRRAEVHRMLIRDIMNQAWSRHREMLLRSEVPLNALTDYHFATKRVLLSEFMAKQAMVVTILQFFFADGAQPEHAVKRVFMVAKAYFEPLVLRMSLQQLATMFGQVRATWSWRGKKKLNGFLAARGVVAVKAPYQKSDAVCEKYAASATGNRNRATGRRVA